jgi:hypothetical protein
MKSTIHQPITETHKKQLSAKQIQTIRWFKKNGASVSSWTIKIMIAKSTARNVIADCINVPRNCGAI